MSTFIHTLADLQTKDIGENAMIAAGSVVFKDVAPNTTYIEKKNYFLKESE